MTLARLRPVLASCAAGVIATLLLAGCAAPPPTTGPPGTPEPEPTPLYATDEEALAAAKDSYAKYIAVSNEVGHNGWADLEPLNTVATGTLLKGDRKSGAANRARGYRIEGDISGEVDALQRIDATSVTVYACLDVGATRVIDSSGQDRTSEKRAPIVPLQVELQPVDGRLFISKSDLWSGRSFCS